MSTLLRKDRWPAACYALIVFTFVVNATAVRAEDTEDEEEASPVQITRNENGNVVLSLDADTQQRISLAVKDAESRSIQPSIVAHGRLESNPGTSSILRSPVAGILRSADEQPWPGIGSAVSAGVVLGYVEPRFTPSEMVDLQARRMDAHAELDEVEAELEAARASLESKSQLDAKQQGLVSDRALEETRARFKSSEARLTAARQKVDLFESLVAGNSRGNALFPIVQPSDGEVVELLAQPGEVVDMGQILLRTADFDSLIATVALFLGDDIDWPISDAQIVISEDHDLVLTGRPMGPGASASSLTGGPTLMYEIRTPGDCHLRPGAPVTAHIPVPGAARNGALIPRSAVLRHGGLTWVYVKIDDNRFERRCVSLDQPTANGWLAVAGVSQGDRVVVRGAQFLLSEELKSQIENEAEAEE